MFTHSCASYLTWTLRGLFLQWTTKLEATPSWLWRTCSNPSSRPTTQRPNGSMVSRAQHWLLLLQELFGWIRLRCWKGWNTSAAGLQEISASGCDVCSPLITVKTVIRLIIPGELFSNLSDSLVKCLHFLSTTLCYRTYIHTNTLNLTWHEWHLDSECVLRANSSAASVRQHRGDVSLCRLPCFVIETH